MTGPRVLFLDQTGELGGGELALRDVVAPYRNRCRVVLFGDGPLRGLLEDDGVAVTVLAGGLGAVRRESGLFGALAAGPGFGRLVAGVRRLAGDHDLIYANSQKALLVGAVVARLTRTPMVSHLHDILIHEHFSRLTRRLSVTAANRACRRIIADSQATARAFVEAGGRADIVDVVHYGFVPPGRSGSTAGSVRSARTDVRRRFGIDEHAFVVGHVGRLSPWKGQDLLIRALADVPDAVGLIVGRALFGEDDLAEALPALGQRLGLADRLVFTGFRHDVTELMRACDLMVHSSTSPEPFGRVIVEAMLAGVPVVAAGAGGPCEIIEPGLTGWLTPPGDVDALAARIIACRDDPDERRRVADAAATMAGRRFTMEAMHAGIADTIALALGSAPTSDDGEEAG